MMAYGKQYFEVREAVNNGNGYYEAIAINPEDTEEGGIRPAYKVVWYIEEDAENEEDCCDWDCPDEVKEIGGYIVSEDRIV